MIYSSQLATEYNLFKSIVTLIRRIMSGKKDNVWKFILKKEQQEINAYKCSEYPSVHLTLYSWVFKKEPNMHQSLNEEF